MNTSMAAIELTDLLTTNKERQPGETLAQGKPRRVIFLSCIIVCLTTLLYALHTVCTFLLQLSENEQFIAKVVNVLRCNVPQITNDTRNINAC
jgi:hypothetical protein